MTTINATHLLAACGIAGMLVVSACSSDTAGAGASATPTPAAEAQNGEAAPVRYVDSRYHYQIDGPGHMTSNADGSASFIGPSERLEISVAQGSKASDPTALANADAQSLAGSAAGFHQVSKPTSVTVGNLKAIKFVYTWNAGTSAVTGKTNVLTSVRYYIAKDPNTLAVISYGIVSTQYDPQGADDVVSTFQWL